MSFKLLGKSSDQYFKKLEISPGDTITLIYYRDDGEKVEYTKEIKSKFVLTDYGMFEFENEFGLTKGVGGYFGERK